MVLKGYELSRLWFDWCFENPERISPNHTALYFFIIEHCNRLGWKQKFGLPTTMAKEAIGIRSYNTYIKTLNDLIDFGFVRMIEKSRNQYSSNIIALSKNNKALDKALDKAFIKHGTKQKESTQQSTDSINKQYNNEQLNNKQTPFNFKKSFLDLSVDEKILSDWMDARKKKRSSNTETSFKAIKKEIELSGLSANECIKIAAEKSWAGFKSEWVKNSNYGNENKTYPGRTAANYANNEELFCGIQK